VTDFDSSFRYTPSQADVTVYKAITSEPAPTLLSVSRWYRHIKSYTSEFDSLPGSSSAGEAFIGTGAAEAPAAEKKEEADDDEIDLFGSDDEEDAEAERLKAERVAAYNAKKAGKPKAAAKVCRNFCRPDVLWNLPIGTLVRRHLRSQALGR
jgi:elongation factor 1-beta